MSEVKVISRTQRIVVNPSTKSVSVINAGPQGPAGKSIAIQGTVANIAGLPSTLDFTDIGKGWITVDSGHLHVWTATGFIDVGSVLGPTGPQGIQGLSGNIGPTGPIGNTGPMGPSTADDVSFTSKYPTVVNHGATAGTARGGTAPIFWIGSVDPTNATNDDELFRTDTVILYKRVAGAWVVVSGSIYVGASAPPSPLDGKLWWDTDEVAAAQTLDPATLALDSAFTSKFSRTVNHGATEIGRAHV